MRKIVSDFNKIVDKSKNSMELWGNIVRVVREHIMEILGNYFELLDKQLVQEYVQNRGYRCENKSVRTLETFVGKVTFTRHLLYDKKGNPHYVLDEVLGLVPHMRMSPDIWQTVAELATSPGMTYRLASKTVKELSGVSMSHTTVKRLVDQAGKAQEQWDQQQRKAIFEKGEVPQAAPIDQLFCEVDGLYVKGIKKAIEIKSMVNYTDWEQVGTNRWGLVDRYVYATVESAESFWEGSYAQIRNRYDLEGSEVIVNGDGAQWIGNHLENTFSEAEKIIRQLDPFHVKRSIRRGLGKQVELRQEMEKAIAKRDRQRARAVIDTAIGNADSLGEEKRIRHMGTYLLNNWAYLQDWREHTSYSKENVRGMGTIESNLRRMAYRMKRRGMRWSVTGAQAVVKIQQGILNKTFEEALCAYRPIRPVGKTLKKMTKQVCRYVNHRVPTRINVTGAPSTSPIGQLEKIGRMVSLVV